MTTTPPENYPRRQLPPDDNYPSPFEDNSPPPPPPPEDNNPRRTSTPNDNHREEFITMWRITQGSLRIAIYRKLHKPSFSSLFMQFISVFSNYSIRYGGVEVA